MRVLIVNTSERTGGAAIAANRLKDALNNSGVKTMMLVTDKETDDITVAALPHKWLLQWHFLWERWCLFLHLHFKRRHLFEVDMANCGSDITGMKEFQEADVIHLHWVNQGMLSLKSIAKILFFPVTARTIFRPRCSRRNSRSSQTQSRKSILWLSAHG